MAGGLQNESDDDDLDEQHEINVTPFIDVILVLLIIFMVAAPLSTVDIPVELPVSNASAPKRPEKPLFVTLKADLTLALGENPVSRASFAQAIDQATGGQKDTRLYLRADKAVPYGELIVLLDLLRSGGYLRVGLVGLDGAGAAPPNAQEAKGR